MSRKWKLIKNFKKNFCKKKIEYWYLIKNSKFILFSLVSTFFSFFKLKDRLFYLLNKIQKWITYQKNGNLIKNFYKINMFLLYFQNFIFKTYIFYKKNKNLLEKSLFLFEIFRILKNCFKKINLLKTDFYIFNMLILENFLFYKSFLYENKNKKIFFPLFIIDSNIISSHFINFYPFFKRNFKECFISKLLKINLFLVFKILDFLILFLNQYKLNFNIFISRKRCDSIRLLFIKIFLKNKITFYDENFTFYNNNLIFY
jgi:hypothetical protein